MSYNIGELFSIPADPRTHAPSDLLADPTRFVGIEIELENMGGFHQCIQELRKNGFWKYTGDDSLRDYGAELITGTEHGDPIRGQDLITAFVDYKDAMEKWKSLTLSKPSLSKRTSVHVHIDVRDMSVGELQKFVLLYVVFEEIFFNWASPERVRNNYTRSVMHHRDVQKAVACIVRDSEQDFRSTINARARKYDAMNLESMSRYGTVEFRLMGGCDDIDRIHKWVNILMALRLAACSEDLVISELPERASMMGMDNVFEIVFGKWGEPLRPYANKSNILKGVRQAQTIMLEDDFEMVHEDLSKANTKKHTVLEKFEKHLDSLIKDKS